MNRTSKNAQERDRKGPGNALEPAKTKLKSASHKFCYFLIINLTTLNPCPFLGAFAKLLKRRLDSSCLSVCLPALLSVLLSARNSVPTGRIFMKFYISVFSENLSKSKFHKNWTRITGTFH